MVFKKRIIVDSICTPFHFLCHLSRHGTGSGIGMEGIILFHYLNWHDLIFIDSLNENLKIKFYF